MNPSVTEKLILQMLCDIHKKLDIKDSYDADLISRAIASGDNWVLGWKYDIKEQDAELPPHVRLVGDALDLYSFLKESYEGLDAAGRQAVENGRANAAQWIEFPGFDGNNEPDHRAAARYIVEDLDGYQSMRDVASRNSHMPVVEMYTRMIEVFEPIRRNLIGRLMTPEEIILVLQAGVHPDNHQPVAH